MPDTHHPDNLLFPVRPEVAAHTHVTAARYREMYEHAARDPDGFWAEQARRVAWMQAADEDQGHQLLRRRRHQVVRGRGAERVRLLPRPPCRDTPGAGWRSSGRATIPSVSRTITYRELHEQVCRLANALRALGAKKGDRITIYLPMVPEAAVAMLACARIGAIHSVVFGGFSPDSLANRLQDCGSTLLITADEGRRGGRKVPLKANADAALKSCPDVKNVVVVRVTGASVPMQAGRDHDYAALCAAAEPECVPEPNERRGPAVHPLHVRQHRQTERRAAHHRRLPRLGQLHA